MVIITPLKYLNKDTFIVSIKHTYYVYKNICDIVFQQGRIHFNGFAFFDLTIYVIGIDQPWVAFMASGLNFLSTYEFEVYPF